MYFCCLCSCCMHVCAFVHRSPKLRDRSTNPVSDTMHTLAARDFFLNKTHTQARIASSVSLRGLWVLLLCLENGKGPRGRHHCSACVVSTREQQCRKRHTKNTPLFRLPSSHHRERPVTTSTERTTTSWGNGLPLPVEEMPRHCPGNLLLLGLTLCAPLTAVAAPSHRLRQSCPGPATCREMTREEDDAARDSRGPKAAMLEVLRCK